jgi:hypothetical protein
MEGGNTSWFRSLVVALGSWREVLKNLKLSSLFKDFLGRPYHCSFPNFESHLTLEANSALVWFGSSIRKCTKPNTSKNLVKVSDEDEA